MVFLARIRSSKSSLWKKVYPTAIPTKAFRMTAENVTEPLSSISTTRNRQFGVYDLMIGIAGIALLLSSGQTLFLSFVDQCMGLFKIITAYFGFIPSNTFGPPAYLMKMMTHYRSGVVWSGLRVSEQLILIVTPVFLLMRFRKPRPPIRVLLKQPGIIAGLAAAIGLILVAGWLHHFFFGRLVDRMVKLIAVGGTVGLAWMCLALSGKWEAEASWVDRFGRLMGVAMIVVGTIAFMVFGLFS